MSWVDFDYAVLRYVSSTHRQEFVNIGLVLHAPAAAYLKARFRDDVGEWCVVPEHRLRAYLDTIVAIAAGDPAGGPLTSLSRSERFHWLTAPRSDSLQGAPKHPGRSQDLDATFDHIFDRDVGPGGQP